MAAAASIRKQPEKRFRFKGIFEGADGRVMDVDGEISAISEKNAQEILRTRKIEATELALVL